MEGSESMRGEVYKFTRGSSLSLRTHLRRGELQEKDFLNGIKKKVLLSCLSPLSIFHHAEINFSLRFPEGRIRINISLI